MLYRCNNPKSEDFKNYGGRGIMVCERWGSFVNFLADMGVKPERLELDRVNNGGNYEPGNCQWTTKRQNLQNRRNTAWVMFNGEKLAVAEAARRIEASRDNLSDKIRALGLHTGQLAEIVSAVQSHRGKVVTVKVYER